MAPPPPPTTSGAAAAAAADAAGPEEPPLLRTLRLVDPFLVFLTKKSGQASVPLPILARALPPGVATAETLRDVAALADRGILWFHKRSDRPALAWDDAAAALGFPEPVAPAEAAAGAGAEGSLHGSTKTGARRRLRALQRQLRSEAETTGGAGVDATTTMATAGVLGEGDAKGNSSAEIPLKTTHHPLELTRISEEDPVEQVQEDAAAARRDLERLLNFADPGAPTAPPAAGAAGAAIPTRILEGQIAYAGTHPAQAARCEDLSAATREQIPAALWKALGLDASPLAPSGGRRLYRHQARAIEAAFRERHCIVCTGTGSGKSLCFLVPVLTAAYQADRVSLVLYPTKALAQDQLAQLQSLLRKDPGLAERIRPATLDGDTPHALRAAVADTANVVLTNPDALHAAILPHWRHLYARLLSRLAYVALDEAHLYEGVFGAHVSMVLARLLRVAAAAAARAGLPPAVPTFLAASATLPWPAPLFRALCPLRGGAPVEVVGAEDDGSPRAAKHFFVWNPPLLRRTDNASTEAVASAAGMKSRDSHPHPFATRKRKHAPDTFESSEYPRLSELGDENFMPLSAPGPDTYRRHAADETALLLARALVTGVRCIAFCRTRNLVEWVYERTVAVLKSAPSTASLVEKLESYRGGYSKKERRQIEQKLFQGELLGVVGTNALELGVDIGGINLTLHCGYPSSYASLLQQAGRAGRDKNALAVASCSVVVCFDSAAEQHLWRNPRSLLGRSSSPKCPIPLVAGLVQAHVLCASEEFPLTKDRSVTCHIGENEIKFPSDRELFGEHVFDEALEELTAIQALLESEEKLADCVLPVYQINSSRRKPWAELSIRAIEPVNYSIIDLSHPGQKGRMDTVHDRDAIMDVIPYSRVFYYSFPGAIILHRGAKFKIIAMSTPPPIASDKTNQRLNLELLAFAKPSRAQYFTRPLSHLNITIVKTLHRVEKLGQISSERESDEGNTIKCDGVSAISGNSQDSSTSSISSLAGCGTVTVKRRIYGFKKVSRITRLELSRSELVLPDFEYDTFGVWLDVDRVVLLPKLGESSFGAGVHALSHALLAVAPIFVPGLVRQDLECDHSYFDPKWIMLFDERAGGSGSCQKLWDVLFQSNGLLEAAIEILEDCQTCAVDSSYDGGCPACIHASNCLNFNMHLSRNAGAVIGRHILSRLKQRSQIPEEAWHETDEASLSVAKDSTPRRLARERGLRRAKQMSAAQQRQFVVGRPAWPLD